MPNFEKLSPEAEKQRLILEEWLPSADFEKDDVGDRKYKNVRAHVLPLLEILGLQDSKDWGIALKRFSTTRTVENETGPVHLIPIHTVSGKPEIVPGGPLKPGFKVYVNSIKIRPEVDCLFIMSMHKKT